MNWSFAMSRTAFILCAALLLSSCNGITIFPTATPEPRSTWIDKWLDDPTCQPPCWENLIPGETNISDGLEILSHIPGVKITWYPWYPSVIPTEETQIMWDFANRGEGGVATTEKKGQEIATIALNISGTQFLPLKEVFSSYGFPSDVYVFDCRGEITAQACGVHLIYPKNGMALELLLRTTGENDNQVTIEENARVGKIWLFPLGDNGYRGMLGTSSGDFSQNVVPWKGFGKYP